MGDSNRIMDLPQDHAHIERVAAYIRVSHQEQKLHGLSLDAQVMKLTEYAQKHDMRIVGWYRDEGVSGKKLIKHRPELQRMIQDAEAQNFERIIFIKLDRFFRSVAEYHECMKRIAPVVWTATEEDYDLATANGRMLVNMKLTIAEMEVDTRGERIRITNEYKVQTGQPLVGTGSLPFGYMVGQDKATGRKNVVKNPDEAPIVDDVIRHVLMHHSMRKALLYVHAKYQIDMSYGSLAKMLGNPMLCGEYRGNPLYCEPYITRKEFDVLQSAITHNVKCNSNRDYIFSGLIPCPHCGHMLAGFVHTIKKPNDKVYKYKKYRCSNARINGACDYVKVINERVLEAMMLKNIYRYLEDAKLAAAQVTASEALMPEYDIDALHAQIDRLNYSWQTGKIRTVEQYERDFAALAAKIEQAKAARAEVKSTDYSAVEEILHDGWQAIYSGLDDAHKRAFWRSFVASIELHWETDIKEVVKVIFRDLVL